MSWNKLSVDKFKDFDNHWLLIGLYDTLMWTFVKSAFGRFRADAFHLELNAEQNFYAKSKTRLPIPQSVPSSNVPAAIATSATLVTRNASGRGRFSDSEIR